MLNSLRQRKNGPLVSFGGVAAVTFQLSKGASAGRSALWMSDPRKGTPEDVGRTVLFLVTDGEYITGQTNPR